MWRIKWYNALRGIYWNYYYHFVYKTEFTRFQNIGQLFLIKVNVTKFHSSFSKYYLCSHFTHLSKSTETHSNLKKKIDTMNFALAQRQRKGKKSIDDAESSVN